MTTYVEKLKDPRWQKKRLKIFERDHWMCQLCQSKDKTLHVHHKVYFKNKNPWDYHDMHLVTLCEDCHEHETQDLGRALSDFCAHVRYAGFMSCDIDDLSTAFSGLHLPYPHEVMAKVIMFAFRDEDTVNELVVKYFANLKGGSSE